VIGEAAVSYRYDAASRNEIQTRVDVEDGRSVTYERRRFDDSWYYGEQPWGDWHPVADRAMEEVSDDGQARGTQA
jgi:hypothetical protein